MLRADLPEDIAEYIEIIVFDVSRPEPPEKRRKGKSATPKKRKPKTPPE